MSVLHRVVGLGNAEEHSAGGDTANGAAAIAGAVTTIAIAAGTLPGSAIAGAVIGAIAFLLSRPGRRAALAPPTESAPGRKPGC